MLAFVVWEGLAGAVTGRRSWLLGLGAVVFGIGFMVLVGGNAAAGQAPLTVPTGSESANVQAALTHPFGAISPAPPMVSADGKAAIGVVPIRAGLGILLDTFIVRTLVIPALFVLIGDRIRWPTTNAKPVEQQADLVQHERSAV